MRSTSAALAIVCILLLGCATHFKLRCSGKGKLTGGGGPYAGVIEWDCGDKSTFFLDKSIMQLTPGPGE